MLSLCAYELYQQQPRSNICLPDSVHSCMQVIICLRTEYCIVDTVNFRRIDRKSVREAANSEPCVPAWPWKWFFVEGPFLTEEKFTWDNGTVEWAFREACSLPCRGVLFPPLLLQQNAACCILCAPTTQQAFQLEECRRNWVCCGLGRHQPSARRGGDAEQKAATVQCHCLQALLLKRHLVPGLDLLACSLLF